MPTILLSPVHHMGAGGLVPDYNSISAWVEVSTGLVYNRLTVSFIHSYFFSSLFLSFCPFLSSFPLYILFLPSFSKCCRAAVTSFYHITISGIVADSNIVKSISTPLPMASVNIIDIFTCEDIVFR